MNESLPDMTFHQELFSNRKVLQFDTPQSVRQYLDLMVIGLVEQGFRAFSVARQYFFDTSQHHS